MSNIHFQTGPFPWEATYVKDPTRTASLESYRMIIMDLSEGRVDAKKELGILFDKKIVNKVEADNIAAMIDSPDLENLTMAKAIIQEKNKKLTKNRLKFWK